MTAARTGARRKRAKASREPVFALAERVKELDCLYRISRLTDRVEFDLDEALQKIVEIVPAAWQHPDVACARLVVDGVVHETKGFAETEWSQEAMVIADGAMAGRLVVCYLAQRPDADEGPFLNEERDLLNVLAQRIGEIVERQRASAKLRSYQAQLRSLAWQITSTEERARREIATMLHDRVGQALASARVNLHLASGFDLPAHARELLEDTGGLLRQAIRDTRVLIFDISPPILYEVGLGGAVEWAAEQARTRYGVDVACSSDRIPPLDDDAAAAIFQACRELLNNAGRHAKASRIEIGLRWDGTSIELTVSDDGVGFDVAAARERALRDGHFGIFSVRERFEHLGGVVSIDSAVGRGTAVTVRYFPALGRAGARR